MLRHPPLGREGAPELIDAQPSWRPGIFLNTGRRW